MPEEERSAFDMLGDSDFWQDLLMSMTSGTVAATVAPNPIRQPQEPANAAPLEGGGAYADQMAEDYGEAAADAAANAAANAANQWMLAGAPAGGPGAFAHTNKVTNLSKGVLSGESTILENPKLTGGWTPEHEVNSQIETMFDSSLADLSGTKPKVVIMAESNIDDLVYRSGGDVLDKTKAKFTQQAYDFKENNPQFDVQIVSGYGHSQMNTGLSYLKESGFVDDDTSVMFMGHYDDSAKYFGIPPDELSQVFRDTGMYNQFKDVYLGSCHMADNPWGCANISFAVGDQIPVYGQRDHSWGEGATYAGYRKSGGDYPYKYDPSMKGSAFSVGADTAVYEGFDVEGSTRDASIMTWGIEKLGLGPKDFGIDVSKLTGGWDDLSTSRDLSNYLMYNKDVGLGGAEIDVSSVIPGIRNAVVDYNPLEPIGSMSHFINNDVEDVWKGLSINDLIKAVARTENIDGKRVAKRPFFTKEGFDRPDIEVLLELSTDYSYQFGQFLRSGDQEVEDAMTQAFKDVKDDLGKYNIEDDEARIFVMLRSLQILQDK